MNWFSGTLKWTTHNGWKTVMAWPNISFAEAMNTIEQIRTHHDASAEFFYEPHPTKL